LRVAVMISITTLDDNLRKQLEPNAPSPTDRFDAVKTLNKEGIPTGIRFDPIFYQLTDKEIPDIVKEAYRSNAKHLLASTFKGRRNSMKPVRTIFPNILNNYHYDSKLKTYYLDQPIRQIILTQVQSECKKYGLPFATCREGFKLNTGQSCNGSHLIP
jgi:DNA repair photolyase